MAPSLVRGKRMQNHYYAAMERELKAFIAVGFGQLALPIKKDSIRDRETNPELRARLEQLEERFDMVNGGQAGRGLTPLRPSGEGGG